MINFSEVRQTNEMIEKENLDVRTITMGISLMDCIDSLGEPDSFIIMKKYYMDMDSKQIAAELAMKPSAVRMRCSRAASKLKELLEARGFMEGIL